MIVDKKDTLLESMRRFYDEDRMKTLVDLLDKKSPVSLRLMDYLVTNYAKKRNIVYAVNDKSFNLFIEYKSQLKAYSKRWFDPFCRRERIEFNGVTTTVGQLNFMRWAMVNGVVRYALEHLEAVEADMNDATGSARALKKKSGEKRKELCKAAVKSCTRTDIVVTVRF
jgi:hypothetical protein